MKPRFPRRSTETLALLLILVGSGCAATERHSVQARVARIAFCNAEALSLQETADLATRVSLRNPQVVWYRGPLFATRDASPGWRSATFKENILSTSDRGPVTIAVIPPGDLPVPGNPAYTKLMNTLSLTTDRWKIVLMERSPALPRIDRRRLALIHLLQRERVTLAVAADNFAYARTIPVGPDNLHTVRHITLGVASAAPPAGPKPSFLAGSFAEPHFAILEATHDTLHWTVYDLRGILQDALTIRMGPTPSRFAGTTEILAEENAPRPNNPETNSP